MKKNQLISSVITRFGGKPLLDAYWGANRLTVLAHHRIEDPASPAFTGLEANVSATPAMFEEQIAYIAQNYNVISLKQLEDHIQHHAPLPEKPLLITFDDGYLDNYENAYPVLKRHNLPAVIFLVTSRMENPAPLWWDECAYYFANTTKTQATLPLIGAQQWESAKQAQQIANDLMAQIKVQPTAMIRSILDQTQAALEVSMDVNVMPRWINWTQVNELVENGIACQPHTVSHPIMTRISLDEARQQLSEARDTIQAKTGQQARSFAYPNGTPVDYNHDVMNILKDEGYIAAFTLTSGPMPIKDIQRHPLQIRRVPLSRRDTFDIFITKLLGLPALISRTPYI